MSKYFDTERGKKTKERLEAYGKTVIAYHEYELHGKDSLIEEMRAMGYANAAIEVVEHEPDDFEEKLSVAGHKIWVFTPILPIVVLSTK